MALWHLTTDAAWSSAHKVGEYRAPSLAAQGFIHLSSDTQWRKTAARFFRGQRGLTLLSIRPELLRAEVRWESADGDTFPHLYGALNLDAVTQVFALSVDANGAVETLAP